MKLQREYKSEVKKILVGIRQWSSRTGEMDCFLRKKKENSRNPGTTQASKRTFFTAHVPQDQFNTSTCVLGCLLNKDKEKPFQTSTDLIQNPNDG